MMKTDSPQPTGIEALVCRDIAMRQAIGFQKYGKTVADNKLTEQQWRINHYEELLDAAIYVKKQIIMHDENLEDRILANRDAEEKSVCELVYGAKECAYCGEPKLPQVDTGFGCIMCEDCLNKEREFRKQNPLP